MSTSTATSTMGQRRRDRVGEPRCRPCAPPALRPLSGASAAAVMGRVCLTETPARIDNRPIRRFRRLPRSPTGAGQRTTTRLPIGIRSAAQIMLMAALLSRAQPCESGHGGMFPEPCTAMPRWKKRGRQSSPSELVDRPVDGAVDRVAAARRDRDGAVAGGGGVLLAIAGGGVQDGAHLAPAHDHEDLAVEVDLDPVAADGGPGPHAGAEGLEGARADDAVTLEPGRLLEGPDGLLGERPERPVGGAEPVAELPRAASGARALSGPSRRGSGWCGASSWRWASATASSWVIVVVGVGVAVCDGVGVPVASTAGAQVLEAVGDGEPAEPTGSLPPGVQDPLSEPHPASSTAAAVSTAAVLTARVVLL